MSKPKPDESVADGELVARDSKNVLRPWSGGPVAIVKGEDCVVTDADGVEYLDFTSGYFVNQVGHCHPRIIAAATEQMSQVTQVSGKQATPASVALAERLVEITPTALTKTMFATGGSEATEFALKMVRQNKEKEGVAYLDNAYHGLTLGALELCSSEKYRKTAGVALSDRAYKIPNPYCYRCKHADNCVAQCLDKTEKIMDERPPAAALVAEPIQSVGGIIPPEQWWQRIDKMRRERGMLLVLDEIQTGLGRTGTMFAAEHYGLEPDVLTAGKGLSGGIGSLSVAMTTDEVAATFVSGTTPTNAGNAVSAAAGLALINVLVDEKLIDNSAAMGRYFAAAVADLDDPWVGDIRFKGLLGGVELVADRDSKKILPKAQMAEVAATLKRDGMLITVSGPHGNVLRLQPP
ncbi:MAG: aspartate aminotransferase family protein, partial [Myxococcota bacterium]